jgi:hypothetical protein
MKTAPAGLPKIEALPTSRKIPALPSESSPILTPILTPKETVKKTNRTVIKDKMNSLFALT